MGFVVVGLASAETIAGVGVLSNSQDFDGLYSDFQKAFLPIIVPGGGMFLQPVEGVIPFEQEGFERRFLAKLIGTMHPVSGSPIYSVFAMEDAFSHEVVIFNEDLKEIARIPRPESYSPFGWLESKYGAAALTTDLIFLYNPARMIAEYSLIPSEYLAYHTAALEEQAILDAAMAPTVSAPVETDKVVVGMALVPAPAPLYAPLSSPPPPDGDEGGDGGGGGGSSNLLVELTISLPVGFGYMDHIEVFFRDNLCYPTNWNLADDWVPVLGSQDVKWVDESSSNKACSFFFINDGFDTDGDGRSDFYETLLGSDPNEFTGADSNSNGITDWLEFKVFGVLDQTLTLYDDTDQDGLFNYEELVVGEMGQIISFLSSPILADSDFDGVDDFDERRVWLTNPLKTDTDGDGRSDGQELNATLKTDANNPDTTSPIVAFAGS